MATILICGHRAYAARGLKEVLESAGHNVLEFSRGCFERSGNVITGPVTSIDNNAYFNEDVDVVINFILLQQQNVEENVKYINSLLRFCVTKRVKRLIQISSISAYPNDCVLISENTPTETDLKKKGGYGILKSAIDNRLKEAKNNVNFDIVFVRPGYIVADDNPHKYQGVAKFIGSNFSVLIGNKRSTLPIIHRDVLHKCLLEISTQTSPLPVYLLVEGQGSTKYSYFKSQCNAKIIPLPKWPFVLIANLARYLHLISDKTSSGIKGVFKVQKFDNTLTKNRLKFLK